MTEAKARRSKRLILDVPLAIRGESEDKTGFQEETFTVTVSAHGALIVLGAKVALGQKVVLRNLKNRDEREGTIAFLGPPYAGLATVGIQFAVPSPSSGQSVLLHPTGISSNDSHSSLRDRDKMPARVGDFNEPIVSSS